MSPLISIPVRTLLTWQSRISILIFVPLIALESSFTAEDDDFGHSLIDGLQHRSLFPRSDQDSSNTLVNEVTMASSNGSGVQTFQGRSEEAMESKVVDDHVWAEILDPNNVKKQRL